MIIYVIYSPHYLLLNLDIYVNCPCITRMSHRFINLDKWHQPECKVCIWKPHSFLAACMEGGDNLINFQRKK